MKDMPYQTKQLTCRDSECNTKYYVKGHTFVKSYSRDALYTAIAQQPVAGALEASSREFQLYKSGILNSGCTTEINHAVTLVGFSYNRYMWFWKNHYILVKNSWGSSWGDNGFIKIGSNSLEGKGMCGIYQYNVFPKV
jgi:C1A family cysteine protease